MGKARISEPSDYLGHQKTNQYSKFSATSLPAAGALKGHTRLTVHDSRFDFDRMCGLLGSADVGQAFAVSWTPPQELQPDPQPHGGPTPRPGDPARRLDFFRTLFLTKSRGKKWNTGFFRT